MIRVSFRRNEYTGRTGLLYILNLLVSVTVISGLRQARQAGDRQFICRRLDKREEKKLNCYKKGNCLKNQFDCHIEFVEILTIKLIAFDILRQAQAEKPFETASLKKII
jgi:hypothetical protein